MENLNNIDLMKEGDNWSHSKELNMKHMLQVVVVGSYTVQKQMAVQYTVQREDNHKINAQSKEDTMCYTYIQLKIAVCIP